MRRNHAQIYEKIRNGMTEKEKTDQVAECIGEISDYEYYDSDWTEIFLRRKSDASVTSGTAWQAGLRWKCIRAQGCGSLNEHGKTVVKADGKYYIYTTGFDEPLVLSKSHRLERFSKLFFSLVFIRQASRSSSFPYLSAQLDKDDL